MSKRRRTREPSRIPDAGRAHGSTTVFLALTNWPAISLEVTTLIAVGVGLLSMTPPEFRTARLLLGSAAVLSILKTAIWSLNVSLRRWERVCVIALLPFLAFAAFGSWRWVDGRQHAWDTATQRLLSADAIATKVAHEIDRPKFAGGVVLRVLSMGKIETIPEVGRRGVKVQMHLANETFPPTQLENVTGQVWTESRFLLATVRRTPSPLDHPWFVDRARQYYTIRTPVFPKMSGEWLPTLVFALPPPGERALFGAQIVSRTTDYRQYMWALSNENGTPSISGGDATPPNLSKRLNPQ